MLRRCVGSIQPRPQVAPLVIERETAFSPLPEPPGNREYVLELVVSHQGLVKVAWDGGAAAFKNLADDPARPLTPGAYQGDYGLFCQGCSVQLASAAFIPAE